MGTENGEVIIWENPSVLYSQRKSSHCKSIKKHYDNCHLIKWTKDGEYLLTASLDGTAKIFEWADEELHFIYEFSFAQEVKTSGSIKCWAISWSAKGTYAIVRDWGDDGW